MLSGVGEISSRLLRILRYRLVGKGPVRPGVGPRAEFLK